MLRVLFEKKGDAVWISHLDLMRVFQRAFRRAGLLVKHSRGFSPRAIVSIALPLAVGMDSCCELLDFEVEGETPPLDQLLPLLNEKLPEGIRADAIYPAERKIKELTYLHVKIRLTYDQGVPENGEKELQTLFGAETLLVEKWSKRGNTQVDILPMIRNLQINCPDDKTVELDAVVCAQNPALNPQLLVTAIETYRPELAPDFSSCSRMEVLDGEGNVFR